MTDTGGKFAAGVNDAAGQFATALLQDLTQDSATLTGWRRTKRSGEGKTIALYCPGIYCLRYRSFPRSTEVFRNYRKFRAIFPAKKERVCAG